jgi:hypothetical protein
VQREQKKENQKIQKTKRFFSLKNKVSLRNKEKTMQQDRVGEIEFIPPKKNVRIRAVCFSCKKKFIAGKNQHPKYSLCPMCKRYKAKFVQGESWIDCRLFIPKKSSLQ